MIKTILTTTLSFSVCSTLLAGPAEDIAKKHASARALELEAYIKANPEADDKAEAVDYLLDAYNLTENSTRTIALLEEKFNNLGAGEDVNAQELYRTVSTIFNLHLNSGNKEAAKKLLESATAKGTGNRSEDQLARGFDQLGQKLSQPSKGESMDIKFTSLDGKEVDLAAMKGKVVLVDFWATWCGPCIAELPHVQETYEQYKEQGFEIIGISLDKEADKEKLITFVKDKKMTWPQHFDGKGWGNELAKKFGITGIPATYLIGKDGKIVAANLRGNALKKTVSEYIAK